MAWCDQNRSDSSSIVQQHTGRSNDYHAPPARHDRIFGPDIQSRLVPTEDCTSSYTKGVVSRVVCVGTLCGRPLDRELEGGAPTLKGSSTCIVYLPSYKTLCRGETRK